MINSAPSNQPTLPTVAIVGRPNVGKSTFFNRLLRERLSVVHDNPGTTRDRLAARVISENTSFLLVDTGGIVLDHTDEMEEKIRAQADIAIDDADLIILITDAMTGLHPADKELANLLRRRETPVIVVVNKCDTPTRNMAIPEFNQLGLGDPIPISALHNRGVSAAIDQIEALLPSAALGEEEQDGVLRLALVGRPNVGKSTLLNAILGVERSIVTDTPGTTRDAVDTSFEFPFVFLTFWINKSSLAMLLTFYKFAIVSVSIGIIHFPRSKIQAINKLPYIFITVGIK